MSYVISSPIFYNVPPLFAPTNEIADGYVILDKLNYPSPINYITSFVTTGLPFISNIINPLLPDNLSKWEDPLKYII